MEKPYLYVCTEATEERTTLEQLQTSCKAHNINLTVLGMGQPFQGFGEKFIQVRSYINTLSDSDVLLFVDAYDTLILKDKSAILDTFLSMNVSCVVSAERVCWPDENLAVRYPLCATSYKYVNSGAYIGYVGFLKKLFQDISPFTSIDNDQALLTEYFLKHQDSVILDTNCKLFLSTYGLCNKDLQIYKKNRNVVCLETGFEPAVLHGNGYSPWYQYVYDCFFSNVYSSDSVEISSQDEKTVFLALLIGDCPEIVSLYLRSIEDIMYEKRAITLYVHYYGSDLKTKELVEKWYTKHARSYNDSYIEYSDDRGAKTSHLDLSPPMYARDMSFKKAQESSCDYYFTVNTYNFITPFTLKELIARDKPIIAPLLRNVPEIYDLAGNFCYDLTDTADFKDHLLHSKIYFHKEIGTFAVSCVFGTYLIKNEYLRSFIPSKALNEDDRLSISKLSRERVVEQYICNEKNFGVQIHYCTPLTLQQEDALYNFLSVSSEWGITI